MGSMASLKYNCKVQTAELEDEVWAFRQPTLFPEEGTGLQKVFTGLQTAFLDRIQKHTEELYEYMDKMEVSGAVVILPELGPPMDEIGQLKWVPLNYQEHDKKPAFLNTFGSAWPAMSLACSGQTRPEEMPSDGLGTLVQNVNGAVEHVLLASGGAPQQRGQPGRN